MGRSQRSHVHPAYKFHALLAIGSALRSRSGASFSRRITGLAFDEIFSTLGLAAVCRFSGMVKLVPQYVQAMRLVPASGLLGAPQAEHEKVGLLVI